MEELRNQLLQQLDMSREIDDQEILDCIDELVLKDGKDTPLTITEKNRLRRELFDSIRKLDVLQELIDDDEITEIMVNGYQDIFVERGGIIQKYDRQFSSPDKLDDVIQQIVGQCNRVVNEQIPIVDARLENGSRVNVVLKPIALNGPIISIRRFPDSPITMSSLVSGESLTQEAADFLQKLVVSGYSIMIGGGTSSGKTTFLNALSYFIPSAERVITIEDNAELQIQNVSNLVRLESRTSNMGESLEITMDDLIKSALRMRPNRIIVGEIRGGEARSYITSLNLGHNGSMATAHANSAGEMISRLEMMVLMGMELPLPAIRRQIASGVEILIHLGRDTQGRRRVEEIAEVLGLEQEEVRFHTLYERKGGALMQTNSLLHREKLKRAGL
ncbi:CpaF family protein [Novisyntrophococcus fermenticellae]|uniref:CpaF family protein n=1 Tax=Novisyntrophococcus fermenticellae TaxID=2068655 RepID=UPI001E47A082|nr:CpaF family protein [Novisyntrophococcus fermenticellae]